MKKFLKIVLLFLLAGSAFASASVSPAVLDGGGGHSVSVSYANDGSIGGFGGVVTASSPQVITRTGYAGQLYEVTGFSLTAASTNLNESTSMPLSAMQFLDDGTVSPANSFAIWSFTAPISGINSAGIVTAGNVNQDTPTTVTASLEGWSASLNLMVLNIVVELPGYNQMSGQLLDGGQMQLSFVGHTGTNYALDRAYNLSPPITWMPQVTNAAGVNGLLIFTNLANTTTNNFWRIRSVP